MSVESLTTSEDTQAHGESAVGFLAPPADESELPAVAIRGVGLLSPLGRTAEETWDALLAGRYITDHARAAGEFDGASPRVIQMARRAASEAMAEAGWLAGENFATVVGTSKGSVESWLGTRSEMPESGGRSPEITGLADIAATVGVGRGPRLTVSAACASGLHALIRGAMMIQSGEARRVLVVASEASVHPLFLGSFKRLGVLPAGEVGCRPFDEARDGFLMSEAAAAVCLENVDPRERRFAGDWTGAGGESPPASDAEAGVRVERFALGADATHLTAADPGGGVMAYLINRVTGRGPVDLVHAHGTGTAANDPTELNAIEKALAGSGHDAPALFSHKGALGHSLGAAGLVAVVLNVFAHRCGVIPPNVRTTRPILAKGVTIRSRAETRSVRRSLALAAGFGGAAAAVGLVTA